MYFILMVILYVFSQALYGDNGRIYQIKIYKNILTPNYGCVGATDKFTCSDIVSVLYLPHLSCFSFMLTIVQLLHSFIYYLVI